MPSALPTTYVKANIEKEGPPAPAPHAILPSSKGDAMLTWRMTEGIGQTEQSRTKSCTSAPSLSVAADGFPLTAEDGLVKNRVHALLKMLAGEFDKMEAELTVARGDCCNAAAPPNHFCNLQSHVSVNGKYAVQTSKKAEIREEPVLHVYQDVFEVESEQSGGGNSPDPTDLSPSACSDSKNAKQRRKSTFVTQSRGFGPEHNFVNVFESEDQPVREAMYRAVEKLTIRASTQELSHVHSDRTSDLHLTHFQSGIRNAFREFKKRAATVASVTSPADHWEDSKVNFACAETLMSTLIVLNCVSIGMASDLARGSPIWFYVECVFLFSFTVERFFKFMALGCYRYWFGHDWKWNIFEFALVVIGFVELMVDIQVRLQGTAHEPTTVQLLRAARLIRLVKIMRIFRLEVFCDLLMMVDGLRYGAKTLAASVVLISVPLYVMALIFRETIGISADPETSHMFATVYLSFLTMFRCIIIGDCAQASGKPVFHLVTEEHGWMYGIIYVAAAFTMTFGLFNVIVSVYVENTLAKVKYNELVRKRQRLEDQERLAEKTSEVIEHVWWCAQVRSSFQGQRYADYKEFLCFEISPSFFKELLGQQRFRDLLRELDVNDDDQMDLFDTLDVDGNGALSVEELVIGIIRLRGDARRADIIAVGLMARNLQTLIRSQDAAVRQLSQDVFEMSKGLQKMSASPWFSESPWSPL